MSSFISSALVECVTEEKPDVFKTLLRMWQVLYRRVYYKNDFFVLVSVLCNSTREGRDRL